jgi:glycerol uptake facilitator-like aquaporin
VSGAKLSRQLAAEGLGTALLLAVVVGSGIMGERLAGGNMAVALLANALATGAALYVLITLFGPWSGAHFNPLVTVSQWASRAMPGRAALLFVLVQVLGAVIGVFAAHAMFDLPAWLPSSRARTGADQLFSEALATFGLLLVILQIGKRQPAAIAASVACYITAAYWFTASTSFANPAVTLARALTDTFSGIRALDVPAFVAAQACGALLAGLYSRWLDNGMSTTGTKPDS